MRIEYGAYHAELPREWPEDDLPGVLNAMREEAVCRAALDGGEILIGPEQRSESNFALQYGYVTYLWPSIRLTGSLTEPCPRACCDT